MNDLDKTKSTLRKHYFTIRKNLTKEEVSQLSQQACDNFIGNLLPKLRNNKNNIFSLYFDAYNEVETRLIAQYFDQHDICYSYPKILKKDHPLTFSRYVKNAKIVHSDIYKDIKEIDGNDFVTPNILIIPLISFDSNKMRLGMGGGFFDRTIEAIKQKNKNLVVIGLSYDFQLFDGVIPHQLHDKKTDYIVTPKTIFS